jgi:hypothetical protein
MKTTLSFTLQPFGLGIRLDYLHRHVIPSGLLQQPDQDGLTHVTPGPSFFGKALVDRHDSDAAIPPLTARKTK